MTSTTCPAPYAEAMAEASRRLYALTFGPTLHHLRWLIEQPEPVSSLDFGEVFGLDSGEVQNLARALHRRRIARVFRVWRKTGEPIPPPLPGQIAPPAVEVELRVAYNEHASLAHEQWMAFLRVAETPAMRPFALELARRAGSRASGPGEEGVDARIPVQLLLLVAAWRLAPTPVITSKLMALYYPSETASKRRDLCSTALRRLKGQVDDPPLVSVGRTSAGLLVIAPDGALADSQRDLVRLLCNWAHAYALEDSEGAILPAGQVEDDPALI